MSTYQQNIARVGQLTPAGGAVVAGVALALTALAFTILALGYSGGETTSTTTRTR